MFCGREWNISAKAIGVGRMRIQTLWAAELEKEGKLGKPGDLIPVANYVYESPDWPMLNWLPSEQRYLSLTTY